MSENTDIFACRRNEDMNRYLFIITLGLAAVLAYTIDRLNTTEDKWKRAESNVKAYSSMLDDAKDNSIVLQLTAAQLKYSKDSILAKLNDVREELNIKDKRLQSLQYTETVLQKTDTIVVNDTIFREPSLALDTIVGDEWYLLRLKLKYPSTIVATPQFKSEKYAIVSAKKETVNPPKKCFILRWFQKKHLVVKVDFIEKNPYVESTDSRYVQVVD
jgi:hypothetical protein